MERGCVCMYACVFRHAFVETVNIHLFFFQRHSVQAASAVRMMPVSPPPPPISKCLLCVLTDCACITPVRIAQSFSLLSHSLSLSPPPPPQLVSFHHHPQHPSQASDITHVGVSWCFTPRANTCWKVSEHLVCIVLKDAVLASCGMEIMHCVVVYCVVACGVTT